MKKQRILCLVLALCMVLTMLPFTAMAVGVEDFVDVKSGSWYYEDVEFVTSQGYFVGTSDTQFQPSKTMNRAMFALVLARLDGAELDNSVTVFDDVPANTWYTGAVTWASEKGLVLGYGNGYFGPADPITREDMCVIMDRYINYYSEKTGMVHEKNGSTEPFLDESNIRAYAKEAVANCQAYGLVKGFTNGKFYPRSNSSRAQVAAVIHRLAWMVKEEPVTPLPHTTYTLTYDANGGVFANGKATKRVQQVDNNLFPIIEEEPTKDGYVFLGWAVLPNGPATLKYGMSASTSNTSFTLYAVWLAEADYIGNAMRAAIEQVNGDYLGVTVRVPDPENDENSIFYGSVGTMIFNGNPEFENAAGNAERKQNLTVLVGVTDDLVAEIIKTAAETAAGIIPGLTVAEVKEIVRDVVDALQDVNISRDDIEDIADSVYDEVVAAGQSLWANFRDDEGNYYTGNVTVTVAGRDYVIEVDQASGTTRYTGSKKADAKSIASALAREMYADLKANTEWTSSVQMDGVVTITFADPDNDYSGSTVNYPHTYPMYVGLSLVGEDLVEYKYDGTNSCVKLRITQEIQESYTAALEQVIAAALENDEVKGELETRVQNALNSNSVIDALKGELDAVAFNGLLSAAVEEWVAANTLTQQRSRVIPGYYLPYEFFWGCEGEIAYDEESDTYTLLIDGQPADKQVLGNNEALYGLIVDLCDALADEVIEKAQNTVVIGGGDEDPANDVTVAGLVDYIIDKIENTAVVEDVAVPGLRDYIIEKTRTTEINGYTVVTLADGIIAEARTALADEYGAAWEEFSVEEQNSFLFSSIKLTINGGDYDDIPQAVRNYLINLCGNKLDRGAAYESYTVDGLVYEVIKAALADETYDEIPASLRDYLRMLCGIELGFETGDHTIEGLEYEAIKVALADAEYADIPASLRNCLEKLCGVELGFESADEYTLDDLVYEAIEIALDDEEFDDVPAAARSYLLQVCGVKLGQIDEIDADVAAEVNSLIDQLVCKTLVGYDRYLELAVKAKDLKTLADVQLGNLATLLKNATFQSYVTRYGGEGTSVVSKLKTAIDKLPTGASVTLNGVTLSAATLDGVKTATNLTGVCNALADIINTEGLRTLSVSSFADGMDVTVKYNSRTFTVNLTIEIEE